MTPPARAPVRLHPLGDAAWIVELGTSIDAATHRRVMGFAQALADARAQGRLPGVVEWVPAYATVTVHFDARGDEDFAAAAEGELRVLARDAAPLERPGRRWRLPVCFDAEFAPDLDELAAACGLAPRQVVALMTATPFLVYMLGFQPGFPYLGGLPAALERPRRATPRTAVPERSVAVAGRMCAVYPWRSPGGWHLLGRTPLALFDPARTDDPAWLHAGDELHWVEVDRAGFDALEQRMREGTLAREAFRADAESVGAPDAARPRA